MGGYGVGLAAQQQNPDQLPPPAAPASDISNPSAPATVQGSLQDLQSRGQFDPQQFQQRIQPPPDQQQSQQPQQTAEEDPFQKILTPLYTKLQQLTPANPEQARGVKGLFQTFFRGAGEGMMNHVGMLTPDQQRQNLTLRIEQIENSRNSWRNTQSEIQQRQALVAAEQQRQQQQAQMFPGALQHQGIENQQSQFTLDQERQNAPTIQIPLDANTAQIAGIPSRFVGQNLTASDWRMIDAKLSAQGYQRQDMGFDGQQGGTWLMDRGGNKVKQLTPVSESGRATAIAKMQLKAQQDAANPKIGPMLVGTSPDGRQVAGTEQELRSIGVSQITKLGSSEAEKVNAARELTSSNGLFHMVNSDLAQFKPEELSTIGAHWNEFATGAIGTGDTRYAALRTDMGLLSTKMMQAHVGSRGSVAFMDHFKGLADQGKMNGDILKTSVGREKEYVESIAMRPKTGLGGGDFFSRFGGKAR